MALDPLCMFKLLALDEEMIWNVHLNFTKDIRKYSLFWYSTRGGFYVHVWSYRLSKEGMSGNTVKPKWSLHLSLDLHYEFFQLHNNPYKPGMYLKLNIHCTLWKSLFVI